MIGARMRGKRAALLFAAVAADAAAPAADGRRLDYYVEPARRLRDGFASPPPAGSRP